MERHITTNTPDADHVMTILDGAKLTLTVIQACELHFFDELEKAPVPPTAGELAKQKKWEPDALRRLLDMMAALKLVKKSLNKAGDAVYEITDAGRFLIKDCPSSFYDYAILMKQDIKELWKLNETIKTGKQVWDMGEYGPKDAENKNKEDAGGKDADASCEDAKDEKMEGENGAGGGGEEEFGCAHTPEQWLEIYRMWDGLGKPHADQLVTAIDLSKHKSVVDLGGGSGVHSFALLKHYPKMNVILVDHKDPMPTLKENFLDKHKEARLTPLILDYNEEDLPKADLYVLGNIIQELEPEKVKWLLNKIHASLNKGGAVLILDMVLNDDHDGPVMRQAWDLTVFGYSQMYSGKEYMEFLQETNYKQIQIVRTQDACISDLVYGLKA